MKSLLSLLSFKDLYIFIESRLSSLVPCHVTTDSFPVEIRLKIS